MSTSSEVWGIFRRKLLRHATPIAKKIDDAFEEFSSGTKEEHTIVFDLGDDYKYIVSFIRKEGTITADCYAQFPDGKKSLVH